MMKPRRLAAFLALGSAFAASVPAHASMNLDTEPVALARQVSATSPDGVVAALRSLGYGADLTADDAGEPLINARIGKWQTFVLFYDCDAKMHDNCQSLQFSASFTPDKPFGPQEATAFARDYRFGALTIGSDKSVVLSWDVVTGGGLDSSVFRKVVENFSFAMDNVGALAFNEDSSADAKRPAGRLIASGSRP